MDVLAYKCSLGKSRTVCSVSIMDLLSIRSMDLVLEPQIYQVLVPWIYQVFSLGVSTVDLLNVSIVDLNGVSTMDLLHRPGWWHMLQAILIWLNLRRLCIRYLVILFRTFI